MKTEKCALLSRTHNQSVVINCLIARRTFLSRTGTAHLFRCCVKPHDLDFPEETREQRKERKRNENRKLKFSDLNKEVQAKTNQNIEDLQRQTSVMQEMTLAEWCKTAIPGLELKQAYIARIMREQRKIINNYSGTLVSYKELMDAAHSKEKTRKLAQTMQNAETASVLGALRASNARKVLFYEQQEETREGKDSALARQREEIEND